MRLFLALCAFLGLTVAAAAQDIRWKPERMTPGDYVSIEQSQGGLIHHVYRGKVGNAYLLESYRGAAPGGTPVFSTYLDRHGNQLRWVRRDGYVLDFRPHDCTRTVGRCDYIQFSPNGQTEPRYRITVPTVNGFTFDEYSARGERLFGGQIALDSRGNAGDGRLSGTQGVQVFRLVGRTYQ